MKSGILLSRIKLQWINEIIFRKEIVNSVIQIILRMVSVEQLDQLVG